jgi:biopolymer transport protein ExbD
MFRKPMSHQDVQDQELNLTPFLDVMIVLIPFLMLCASFTATVVVQAALPTPVANPVPVKIPPPFDLVAQADADSIRIFVDPKGDAAHPLATLRTPRGESGYDSATLSLYHRTLLQVKVEHPTETRLALDASPSLPLERLTQLMDESRTLRSGETVSGGASGELFPAVALKGVYVP